MRSARILAGCAVALVATASACSSNNGLAHVSSPTTNVGSTASTTTVQSCPANSSSAAGSPTTTAGGPTTTAGSTGTAGSTSTTAGATTASTLFATGTVPAVKNATNLSKEPVISAGTGTPPTVLTGKDLVVGTGAEALSCDSVQVQYVGALYQSGQVFDASWTDGNGPFNTVLSPGQTVPGFMDAIIGMRVGGRREIVIPPADGYGAQGQGPIPPNATLVFVIDLLKVQGS